ncbi:hypothetical protein BS78_02G120300 [Paspalum vaginatum]|nr:hypothetical protein BS78_02G120300 [Paspalum vaginatum]KAJ1288861.1 hypothetical protein BS78_02G120300 [Paspalum vaginatum]
MEERGSSTFRGAREQEGDGMVDIDYFQGSAPPPRPARISESPPRRPAFSSSADSGVTSSAEAQSSRRGGGSRGRGDRAAATTMEEEHLFDKGLKRLAVRTGGHHLAAPMTSDLVLADPCSPSASSLRRLLQQLVRVRATISPSSGRLVSFAWLNSINSLAADAEDGLQDLHYEMILDMLGVRRNHSHKKVLASNVSGHSSKTTSTSFFQSASPVRLTLLSITDKLEGLEHGRPEWSAAAPRNLSKFLSVNRLVARCVLLCRCILGITNVAGAEDIEETEKVSVFASDDLACADKVTWMDSQKIPTNVTEPIYVLPAFLRSLLYLDLSSCSSLAQIPSSLGNLHNLSALNLACCFSLHTLPVSLGRLQNLQILVLSKCQKLQNLPMSLCELFKLRLLDLSGCHRLETLPYSFVMLRHLEILNLSDCKRLKELPQPFGILQKLKYLNLLGCHGLDLDVEYKLANLMCSTLSRRTNIQGFPNTFRGLANYLDMSRWWKKNWVHHQCNPKAASLHSYRCDERRIIDRLLSEGSDEIDVTIDHVVTSICIVGESGMGKTELIHRIYNSQSILDYFDLRIWFSMCDKKSLLEKIVELTTGSYCSESPESVLSEIVVEEITGKRFLLVLDDCEIKSQHFWNDLRKQFNVCAKGSAFITATKCMEVTNMVGAMQTYYLSSLSKEECFMIYMGHVLGGLDINSYPELETVGWEVVEKCGGNPMCIKALSGLLCHSEIGLSEIRLLIDGTLPALRLCYDLLPAHLQKCFKFCALFPKDYIFIKHHLVQLWIAQGFVFPEEGSQPEDTGLHYFDELFCRSFFQHPPCHKDHEDKFVMHELFHGLVNSVSKKECFRCEHPFCSLPENISHLSLVLSDFKMVALTKEVRNLQSLLVVRKKFPAVKVLDLNDICRKFGFLRSLNLSFTDIIEFPSSIGNMKYLNFLAVNNTNIKGLPFGIGQVGTLQTLELKNCSHLIGLPESIKNLTNLRHLDVRKGKGDGKVAMPPGIGQLTDLQTLAVFNTGNDLLHCSIRDLKNLSRLRGHVCITGLENIKTADDSRDANIMGKQFIKALTLEWCYDSEGMEDDLRTKIANDILQSFQPNNNIEELVIQNYAGSLFPAWIQDFSLCNLISLTLGNCHFCTELPYFGDIPSLRYLFIHGMSVVESFGQGNSLVTDGKQSPSFPSLEVLTIWEMYDLQFWVGTSNGDFPQLCRLSISRCPKLINLPPLISLVNLSVHYGVQVPSFSELQSIKSLKIEGFHKIKSISFPQHMANLKKLEISDCKELSSIFAYSLSVSYLKVVRCLKLDLVDSLLEDHQGQRAISLRNSTIRGSMMLKTMTYIDVQNDGWNWKLCGERDILGSKFQRSYYRCIDRNSKGCSATKISQPIDNNPNTLSVMYISTHNHEYPVELRLGLHTQVGGTRKRKESDVSSDTSVLKRKPNNLW